VLDLGVDVSIPLTEGCLSGGAAPGFARPETDRRPSFRKRVELSQGA